jgi:adenosylcobinamide kinase/adenosylcobinamide-phosphate guanylyltransferase
VSGRLALVGGGARCGKSAFALGLARERGRRRVFVATAQALDEEMAARIARHRDERGVAFRTVEAPLALAPALASLGDADVVVVDCLTLWLTNQLLHDPSDERIASELTAVLDAIRTAAFDSIVVTNEVGLGLVPETALGRRFRDLAGTVHQRIATAADEVYFAALGMMLRLKPGPIEAVPLSRR